MITSSLVEIEIGAQQFWKHLRGRLPKYREQAEMTQRQLAAVLGTTQANVSMAEAGGSGLDWGIDRTVSWLAALGRQLVAVSPAGTRIELMPWNGNKGAELAALRVSSGYGQAELAYAIGVAPTTLQNIELRGAPSSTTTILRILVACDCAIVIAPTPKPEKIPTYIDLRKAWRDRAKARARRRLARELPAEYRLILALEHQERGQGRAEAKKARDAALTVLGQKYRDRLLDLYREELQKEPPPETDPEAAPGQSKASSDHHYTQRTEN